MRYLIIVLLLLICGCYGGYCGHSHYREDPGPNYNNYPAATRGVYSEGLYYDSEYYDRINYDRDARSRR